MNAEQISLSKGQQQALTKFTNFFNSSTDRVFILKGYAGTGKTTLVKEVIKELNKRGERTKLLASTGRAAKILSNVTGEVAITVHSCIYTYSGFNQDVDRIIDSRENKQPDTGEQLLLLFEVSHDISDTDEVSYYIIDEASMISDIDSQSATQALFGSGRLLKDLLEYSPNSKFIFVGDNCQLPPVSQPFSPALSEDYIEKTFGIRVVSAELTEIVRQNRENDIVKSSKLFRDLYFNPQQFKWAKFPLKGFNNIHIVQSQAELYDLYIKNVKGNGPNDSVLIGFSNKQCSTATRILRPALGINTFELSPGDILMVTQNNRMGLMNGDLVKVVNVGARTVNAGISFINVKVKELFTGKLYSGLLIESILYSGQTNLTQNEQKELFIDFFIRMKQKGIRRDDPRITSALMDDPYLNAFRCVFGYELTCHKSQGGEWNNVYLDLPRNIALQPKPYVYQWMYTAMTRARKELYVVDDFFLV